MLADDIGSRFKELRIKLKLSQKDLAYLLGTKQSKISKIENNIVKLDILFIIHDICKYAGITVEEFLKKDDIEPLYMSEEVRKLIKIAQDIDQEVIEKITELLEIITDHKH